MAKVFDSSAVLAYLYTVFAVAQDKVEIERAALAANRGRY
jgi:hypothetical protein